MVDKCWSWFYSNLSQPYACILDDAAVVQSGLKAHQHCPKSKTVIRSCTWASNLGEVNESHAWEWVKKQKHQGATVLASFSFTRVFIIPLFGPIDLDASKYLQHGRHGPYRHKGGKRQRPARRSIDLLSGASTATPPKPPTWSVPQHALHERREILFRMKTSKIYHLRRKYKTNPKMDKSQSFRKWLHTAKSPKAQKPKLAPVPWPEPSTVSAQLGSHCKPVPSHGRGQILRWESLPLTELCHFAPTPL